MFFRRRAVCVCGVCGCWCRAAGPRVDDARVSRQARTLFCVCAPAARCRQLRGGRTQNSSRNSNCRAARQSMMHAPAEARALFCVCGLVFARSFDASTRAHTQNSTRSRGCRAARRSMMRTRRQAGTRAVLCVCSVFAHARIACKTKTRTQNSTRDSSSWSTHTHAH